MLECSSVENATNNENHRVGAAEASSNLHQRASAESSSISQEISSSSNTNIETVLEERRKRLEADKQRKDDAAKVEQLKQAEMRKAELKKAPTSPALAEQIPYAQQQRKRQQEAREERERILRVIENDKIERKRKEELRKALANADAQETTEHHDGADGLIDQQLSRDIDLTIPARSAVCALQVRLLDGRVIRSEFSFESTLRVDVRRWVEEQESMRKVPYNFRQILMPQPNRLISVSEEEEPLHSLGFIPNATLVTVPIMNYVNAHPHESGLVSRALSVGYNGISEGFGWFSGFFYKRQTSIVEAPTMENTHGSSSTNSTRLKQGTNVRMLRDGLSDPVEEQFYNGNQVRSVLSSFTKKKVLIFTSLISNQETMMNRVKILGLGPQGQRRLGQ